MRGYTITRALNLPQYRVSKILSDTNQEIHIELIPYKRKSLVCSGCGLIHEKGRHGVCQDCGGRSSAHRATRLFARHQTPDSVSRGSLHSRGICGLDQATLTRHQPIGIIGLSPDGDYHESGSGLVPGNGR